MLASRGLLTEPPPAAGKQPSGVAFAVQQTFRRANDSGGSTKAEPAILEIDTGDLTAETTDVIVNPSSRGLSGGGLVDLSVRRVAGPELIAACRAALMAVRGGLLSPGQAVITAGYRLPARFVIHCVPPVYEADRHAARIHLSACYAQALALARLQGLSSISFPAIATGVYGYPVREAAEVALSTVVEQLQVHGGPPRVRFVLFGPTIFQEYVAAAERKLEGTTASTRGARRRDLEG